MTTPNANELVKGYVPRNASKFPIEQTFLTSDSEPTSSGYRFKMPEVWSSARSGKKSIAVRSITHLEEPVLVQFKLVIIIPRQSKPEEYVYSNTFQTHASLYDIFDAICMNFRTYFTDKTLTYAFYDNTLSLQVIDKDNNPFSIKVVHLNETNYGDKSAPAVPFNQVLNQPLNTLLPFSENLLYYNVWDRRNLYFHASFIPFDTYQFLGSCNTIYPHPIVYQDPNTSPLFNVWTTMDLKTPFHVLHERFIIRISFIISTESSYETV